MRARRPAASEISPVFAFSSFCRTTAGFHSDEDPFPAFDAAASAPPYDEADTTILLFDGEGVALNARVAPRRADSLLGELTGIVFDRCIDHEVLSSC